MKTVDRIKELCYLRRLTLAQAADVLKMPRQQLYELVARENCKVVTLERIVEGLGMTMAEFYALPDPPVPAIPKPERRKKQQSA